MRILLTVIFMLFLSSPSEGQLRLPAVISSGMVLQQKDSASLWGWGNPSERILITTSWNNKTDTAVVNLTSDSTGIGNWKEEQFVKCLHEKKWMGLENTRPLMPPMSMMPVTEMSEDELKAIFAYLKTTPAIKNVPPQAALLPPPAK